jgi:hypothetical protein
MKFQRTLTERQCEFGQRTGSKSLIPVIVPMYLESNIMESVDMTGKKMHLGKWKCKNKTKETCGTKNKESTISL